jgi:hypothetical protein
MNGGLTDNALGKSVPFREVLDRANGHWRSILLKAGFGHEHLQPQGMTCPKCAGKDQYNADRDVEQIGKVFCRHCFNKDLRVRPGDGIASVAWMRNIEYQEAAEWVAEQVELSNVSQDEPIDIVATVAAAKRIPVDAFLAYGAKPVKRNDRAFVRVPVYDEHGRDHSHFDLDTEAKGYFKKGQGSSGVFLPGRKPQSGETWLLVEGVKDAAALTALGYTVMGLPGGTLPEKFCRLLTGVHVVLVGDLDVPGQQGAEKSARHLWGIAESIRIARLPGQLTASKGEDVRDVLARPGGEQLVRDAIEEAREWNPSAEALAEREIPQVIVDMDEAVVADEVVGHLGRLGWGSTWIPAEQHDRVRVFCRAGGLVEVVFSDDLCDVVRPFIRQLPASILRERITQACRLVTEKTDTHGNCEYPPTRTPEWLVNAINDRGSYTPRIKPLTAIIESPTIRPDGSILQQPGYDPSTGLLYLPSLSFPAVPEVPTEEDARKSAEILLEVVRDFPFVDEADRSAWLCLVLSQLLPALSVGCKPLLAITANTRGSGKTLLADVASMIAFGRPAARKTLATSEDEMRKVITAIALEGTPSVLFDNVDTMLGGAALDAAITSRTWSDRILGKSRMTGELPLGTVWIATGNNLSYGGDIGRRVLPIRLQTPLEKPEARDDFAQPHLLEWVRDRRADLVVAALTVLRAHVCAGRPSHPAGAWGAFEGRVGSIRDAVMHAARADASQRHSVDHEHVHRRAAVGHPSGRGIFAVFRRASRAHRREQPANGCTKCCTSPSPNQSI